MTKYPLFGEDSSPLYTSRILSLIVTGVLFLLFLLCTAFVKPINKKPKYKTVQIVLNDVPKVQNKTEQASAAAPAPAAPAQTSEVPAKAEPAPEPVQKTVETPKPAAAPVKKVETAKPTAKTVETPKTQSAPKPVEKAPVKTENKATPKKTTPTPAPTVKEYALDMDEAINNQFNNQTKTQPKKEFDWSQFDDNEPVVESKSQPSKTVDATPSQSSFSGSAGTTSNTKSEPIKSSSTTTKTSTSTSAGTNKALESIAKETGNSSTNTSGTSQKAIQTGKSSSDSDIKWTGGAARKLREPETTEFDFSDKSKNLLASYSYTDIKIIFDVEANGYVVRNSIKTTPTVPQLVLGEIADHVGNWRFDEGDSTATATFLCIIKRN